MNAFGRRNSLGVGTGAPGDKPQFGVARPMKGGTGAAPQPAGASAQSPLPKVGSQFPSLPGIDENFDLSMEPGTPLSEAMTRLSDRANAVNEAPKGAEGFDASVHKIKEQVLPRLLERVDPEAAATLTK